MKTTSRFVLWCLAALLLASCGSSHPVESHGEDEGGEADNRGIALSKEAMASAGIVLERASLRAVERTVEVTGRLAYDENRMAMATARIGGRVSKVVADYGAEISAAEVLAWIDSPELGAAQAEYRQALSTTRVREAEYERAQLLLEGQAISHGELLRREAEWETARAELESAIQTLHLLGLSTGDIEALGSKASRPTTVYPVRAPIDGRVTERTASVGQVVAPDTKLFVVAELDSLWLMLQLFEKDLSSVSVGSTVNLECESHPQDRFEGVIDFVADVVDPHSRTISARAVIDNSDGKLKPGMFVYARVAGTGDNEAEPAVLAVPVSAIARVDDRESVFVSREEGVFERREIQPGRRWSEWVEVLEGLDPGENIVVAGTFALNSEALKEGLEGHGH